MRTFLVDFENVNSKGLAGIEQLNENDRVIIFYSENSDTLSFDMHKKVMKSKSKIEYFKVRVGGKNALDFQLSTLLGFLIAKGENSHIFIISNDKGFDRLHDFWDGCYIEITQCIVYRTQTIYSACKMCEKNVQSDEVLIKSINADIQNVISGDDEPITTDKALTVTVHRAEKEPKTKQMPIELTERHNSMGNHAEISNENSVEIIKSPPIHTNNTEKNLSLTLSELLEGTCKAEDIPKIKSCLLNSNSKEDFHNSLEKIFKQQAQEFYKILKPQYLRLKAISGKENINMTIHSKKSTSASTPLNTALNKLLCNTCQKDDIDKIEQCFNETESKQSLYISMIKLYKKDRGCEIYKLLKPEYDNLAAMKQDA